MNDIVMKHAADNIRLLSVAMVERAKSGHPGGAMGGASIINCIYSKYLRYAPARLLTWRDRFFLDPGHMSPMLYSALCLAGSLDLEDLKKFRQLGAVCSGHPEVNQQIGIENTSGPLGQGHAMAVGAAIAAKCLYARTGFEGFNKERIYAYISDGGIQEEVSLGAARIAGTLGLNNLVMLYDSNNIQLSTKVSDVSNEDVAGRYTALGWNVLHADCTTDDVESLCNCIDTALASADKPTLIICTTIMGKGALHADGSSYENSCKTHGAPLGGDAYVKTVQNLGGNVEDPFVIFDDVVELYSKRLEALCDWYDDTIAEFNAWSKANPQKLAQLQSWITHIDEAKPNWTALYDEIDKCKNTATRNASSICLKQFATSIPNMIVASADLCNSDKTDGFIKGGVTVITKDNFAGGFLQCGVSELTMACICNGIALHGGFIAACATFFVFSDYMKPAIRMSALMQLPVKYIFTHDSFYVGEDGPTHQPIEQEAQIRLLEQVQNHTRRMSTLVLRPADAYETIECWQLALRDLNRPTVLILSRQTINALPEGNQAWQVKQGAYVVGDPDVTKDAEYDIMLVGNGSEVSLLCEVAEDLRAAGHSVGVISAPSIGLAETYAAKAKSKLQSCKQIFAVSSGLPSVFYRMLAPYIDKCLLLGNPMFGYSAPGDVLAHALGFDRANLGNYLLKHIHT